MIRFRYDKSGESQIRKRLTDAINQASIAIARDLKTALDDAMQSSVWQRADGTKSDIVDEGRLMASGRVTLSSSGLLIEYTEPYATLVHYGGYIAPYGNLSSRVYLPPRPWVEAVLRGNGPVAAFPFSDYYERYVSQAFNR